MFRSTVRVFEILSRAQYYWKVDSTLISRIKKWILKNQRDDGHFYDTTSSSMEDKLGVTAETISTLVEIGFDEVNIFPISRYCDPNGTSFVYF